MRLCTHALMHPCNTLLNSIMWRSSKGRCKISSIYHLFYEMNNNSKRPKNKKTKKQKKKKNKDLNKHTMAIIYKWYIAKSCEKKIVVVVATAYACSNNNNIWSYHIIIIIICTRFCMPLTWNTGKRKFTLLLFFFFFLLFDAKKEKSITD